MDTFEQDLQRQLDSTPVVDPHSHLRPSRPEADHLGDLVLYHHVWIELVSSGMPAMATGPTGLPQELGDPGMSPLDRLRAALPFLSHIRSTTSGMFLRWLLEDLYGVGGGVLTPENLETVAEQVAMQNADPGWRPRVLGDICHITKSLTVEGGPGPDAPFIGRGAEGVPVNLISGKQGPQQVLADLERRFGRELRTAEDLEEVIVDLGRDLSSRGLHFVGVWVLPVYGFTDPTDAQVTRVLREAREGSALSNEQLGVYSSFVLRRLLEGMRHAPLRTIQLIVGAEVLPPHRSVTQWSGEFSGFLGRLAGEFGDFHFSCSSACDANIQDLGNIAKHVPNVSVCGYWWHALYPFYIRKSIETRLDMVPANKIVAFFSDAYHAEWIYPKLKLVKQVWAEVLTDRVRRGLLTPEIALSLVRQCFHDNPARIYGLCHEEPSSLSKTLGSQAAQVGGTVADQREAPRSAGGLS